MNHTSYAHILQTIQTWKAVERKAALLGEHRTQNIAHRNVIANVRLAYHNTPRELPPHYCPDCDGTGHMFCFDAFHRCRRCEGKGRRKVACQNCHWQYDGTLKMHKTESGYVCDECLDELKDWATWLHYDGPFEVKDLAAKFHVYHEVTPDEAQHLTAWQLDRVTDGEGVQHA